MKHACIHLFISMKAASEKTSPVLTAMHHTGKNAQGYLDGAQTYVIGALCGTVPFAFTAFDCSIDSDVFHTWATEILLPELPACSVIVMDNASFHKRQDTLDALQAEGHTVLWLPPYSPDFNPIEKT